MRFNCTYRQNNFGHIILFVNMLSVILKSFIPKHQMLTSDSTDELQFHQYLKKTKHVPWIGQFLVKSVCPCVYLSNRPHFLWVYRHDNPRRLLGEHEKSL